MPDAFGFLADLTGELASAHTETSLVAAIGAAFARTFPVAWVTLDLADGAGRRSLRHGEPGHTPRSSVHLPLRIKGVLLGGATIALRGEAPAELASPRVVSVAAAIASAALASCRALARAGDVSRRAHADRRELRDELDRERGVPVLVARSRAMRRIVDEMCPLVARRGVAVLLLGESGVGKELLARRIHALSERAARPFIAVNCGAIPKDLSASVLFGHERGSFTGAHARQRGVFERAHRGTLLLDEVAELPLATQAELLRVLQDGEIERVGGTGPLRVDVRIVAATHRDLEAMVRDGRFRLDLYHRLAVVPIVVPPLRERPEDLAVLVPQILGRIARRQGVRPTRLAPGDMRRLRAHPWPGNVRELENVLERAVLYAEAGRPAIAAALADSPRLAESAVLTFAEASRHAIEAALAASGGRIHGSNGAAARLALEPTTLQSKMRRLGMPRKARRAKATKATKTATATTAKKRSKMTKARTPSKGRPRRRQRA